jgi:hypothetical protein
MKARVHSLLHNELFVLLFNGTIAYTALTAIIISTLQVPPEAILDSGLQEILLVFEG